MVEPLESRARDGKRVGLTAEVPTSFPEADAKAALGEAMAGLVNFTIAGQHAGSAGADDTIGPYCAN